MNTETFSRRTRIEAPASEVFAWHAREGAFERLTPPWEHVRLIEQSGGIRNGGRAIVLINLGPVRMRWVAEHRDYQEDSQFCDEQVSGPFARWVHTHRFERNGDLECWLEDRIEYALPLGPLGRMLGGARVRKNLERMFAYRHATTVGDLRMHNKHKGAPMNVLVTGSTGLIGSALASLLTTGGHSVKRLDRSGPKGWDPEAGKLDSTVFDGVDAVVHLAGENIAGRWNEQKKRKIHESRVKGTRLLSETLARLAKPPKVLVCASAIGYYGNRGDEVLREDSASGSDFLAGVCRDWEAATQPAARAGIRVVNLRFGVVLSPKGGALAKMLFPFRIGGGGIMGDGRQYWSWIALDDAIGAIHHALMTANLQGPVNAVAPNAVTNYEFTKTLGRVIGRPTLFPMPAFAARLVFGEMADALLLASQRVEPTRLKESGYEFRFPNIEPALRHLLGK